MGGAATKLTSPPATPKTPKSPGTKKFITPKGEVVNTTPKSTDLFKEVNAEVSSIQKSFSRSSLNELQKSESKSRFLDTVKQRKEIEAAKKEDEQKRERAESQVTVFKRHNSSLS